MWKVEKVIKFNEGEQFKEGQFINFWFLDINGNRYILNASDQWIAAFPIGEPENFIWTAGKRHNYPTKLHIDLNMTGVHYLSPIGEDALLVVYKFGVYVFDISKKKFAKLIDAQKHNIYWPTSCEIDSKGCLWLNDVESCYIFQFDTDGNLKRTLGNGKPGYSGDGGDARKSTLGGSGIEYDGPYSLFVDKFNNIFMTPLQKGNEFS